ncbi:hypothetical protein KIN20_014917, partial [Parelaphostrongylus tenuis]
MGRLLPHGLPTNSSNRSITSETQERYLEDIYATTTNSLNPPHIGRLFAHGSPSQSSNEGFSTQSHQQEDGPGGKSQPSTPTKANIAEPPDESVQEEGPGGRSHLPTPAEDNLFEHRVNLSTEQGQPNYSSGSNFLTRLPDLDTLTERKKTTLSERIIILTRKFFDLFRNEIGTEAPRYTNAATSNP